MFNKSQSSQQFRLPLASTTSRSNFNTRVLSPKLTHTFRVTQAIENIEIQNNFPERDLFFQLQRVWKEHNIPEIHQKYFYYILTTNQASQDYLMRQEIQSFKLNDSIIKTLHQLTCSREFCLKEALDIKQTENIIEYVCLMSNYIYDLRKITLNLVEYYRRWVNKLYIQHKYNYQWIYEGDNYILKIKDDHKLLFQNNPVLGKFFHLSTDVDDIFYLAIINQAYERDLEYFDYLTKHKLQQKYMKRIKELQTFMAVQFSQKQSENKLKTLSLLKSKNNFTSAQNLDRGTSRKQSVTKLELPPLPEYESEVVYKSDEVSFIVKQWPIKEIPQILSFWLATNFEDFHKSFLQPSTYISETLSYGQEAMMLQISDLGLVLASIELDCDVRKWVIHLIICKEQIFDKIIQHFVRMLTLKGDSFEQLGVNLTFLECFEYNLKTLNFYFNKIISIENLKVNYTQYVLDIKKSEFTNIIYDPLCFIYARILSRVKKLILTSDEEMMMAQFSANLGKSTLIKFDDNIQSVSKNLIKQKIYGQSFSHMTNITDVVKACPRFKSPIKSNVYLQQFNINLQFQIFSSEIHKQTHQPYFRLTSRATTNLDEASVLQLQTSDPNNLRKLYLISTIDPSIRMYINRYSSFIFELKLDEVTQDVPSLVTKLFETYDKKNFCQFNLWLPFFSGVGNRQELPNCEMQSFFTSETFLEMAYPRIGMNSINYSFEGEKLISFPFIIGIVQSDLESINKPIFSMLVQQEQIQKTCEPIQVAKRTNKEAEIIVMQINPKDIELRVREIIRFSCDVTKISFEQDAEKLINIMKYAQEACVIQLFIENLIQGYAILYIDQYKVQDRVWIVEAVSCQSQSFFDIFLSYIVDLVFNQDKQTTEILIGQNHYPQANGQMSANKYVSDSIKKVGFKWRIVENDYKTQLRRTIYSMKRQQHQHNQLISIKFQSYYSLQQTDARNHEINMLSYIRTKTLYQFSEDCFHYHMHRPYETNKYLVENIKKNVGLFPKTEFCELESEDQIYLKFNKLRSHPTIDKKHTQIMAQLTNVQLKWSRSREIIIEGSKHIEIPNDHNFIYAATFPKINRRIYYIRLHDPSYYIFVMEVAYNQIEAVRNDYVRFTERIYQEFLNKQPQTSSDLIIPQFESNTTISEPPPNWVHFNFSVSYNHTIAQHILKDLGNRSQRLQLPMLAGLIHEDSGLRYERPIVAYVASEYLD